MDSNNTRHELLLGRTDWEQCLDAATGLPLAEGWKTSPPASEPPDVAWNEAQQEITLRPELHFFQAGATDRPVSVEDRRGAACDRFGNWYWITDTRRGIQVRNSGDGSVRTYWPVSTPAPSVPAGTFHPVTPPAPCPTWEFAGLTVTEDQYLVVGVVDPPGYLKFDLHGGGSPTRVAWPSELITPFDLTARTGGGFLMLDRTRRRLWEFDARFRCIPPPGSEAPPSAPSPFGPSGRPSPSQTVETTSSPTLRAEDAVALDLEDPIAVETLSDGSVLILDRRPSSSLPVIACVQKGIRQPNLTGLDDLGALLNDENVAAFRLEAHDMTVVSASGTGDVASQLYLVSREGNQAFAFELSRRAGHWHLTPLSAFLPLRRFGGRALTRCGDRAFYDSGPAWVPLVEQRRPRYAAEGTLLTPVWDSQIPDCVWHRILFDGRVPAETQVELWSRAANSREELERGDWEPEPNPLRRATGSELPWMPAESCADRGTWETLFQRARGRYAQLKLRLSGNQRLSPRIRAVRVYQPRFSYLRQYLPPVYREDETSASFLERFLANFEGQWTSLEDRMASLQVLLDARTAPAETLEWLASWFGAVLDPAWDESRRRLFLRHAMTFYAYRGTVRGLHLALRLMFDCRPDDRLFNVAVPVQGRQARYRIVERFRQRLGISLKAPADSERWTPNLGADALHARWRSFLGAPSTVRFPVRRPSDRTAEWVSFCRTHLGFVPRATDSDLVAWQTFLRQRYSEDLEALNLAHGTAWTAFDGILLPEDLPAEGDLREDWERFSLEVRGPDGTRQQSLWESFLRRRYQNNRYLQEAYQQSGATFATVPLPTELPSQTAHLEDWFLFEGVVLPMHETAHRFTVLLPLTSDELRQSDEQRRQVLQLADRIIRLEKPAHTVFDVRLFWAAFRVGGVRVGDDTVLGTSSRAADRWPGFELGLRHLSEAFLNARPPRDHTDRLQVGRDRVTRSPLSTPYPRRMP